MINLADLPSVRGSYTQAADLAPFTWMGVGGPAGVLFRPEDAEDLVEFLKGKPAHIPHRVVGAASNLIIRDGGLPDTVVIKLGKGFRALNAQGLTLQAGAAQLDLNVAKLAAKAGIGGLSFLAGIPGTIGGAVRMNAGVRTSETADQLKFATVLDPRGRVHNLTPQDMGLTYRHNDLPADWVVLSATFEGQAAKTSVLEQDIADVMAYRNDHQPSKARTCGSTFKNPKGQSAWRLVDAAGGRGLKRGDAQMSNFHCNFLLNLGQATAAELEGLGEDIRARVKANSGIELEWEVERVGVPA